ncbi:MAG: pilus assembly protein TadG-related protein [Proteobacteria bacterium]|nr:pilus assembly protein TadG-related protein [Pseudomonadota bacterium]
MRHPFRSFAQREDGGISALSLQMFIGALAFGGLAVDFGKGVTSKTQLQIAGDAAAHAAIMTRETKSAEEAKEVALNVAAGNMPNAKYGDVLTEENINFGYWDRDTEVFTVDPASSEAVLVTTQQVSANGNGVTTYMMRLTGLSELDVTAGAVFESYYPTCFNEGMVAREPVDIQSNNLFGSGFCIHSQDHAAFSSGNLLEDKVVVSMPDKRDIELPSSGFESNDGLEQALRDASYQIKILARINDILGGIVTDPTDPAIGIMAPTSRYYRPYVTDASPIDIQGTGATSLDGSKFRAGRIHVLSCKNDNSHKQLGSGFVMQNMVLVTDCRLQFNAGAVIEDSVIITTNPSDKAFYASSNIVLGRDDDCAGGGDVQMIALGGVDFAAGTSVFGSQIIAAGDIAFAANANGIEGVSLVAGGRIDVTSNGYYGVCGGAGMNNNYAAAYFRLAR